MKTIRLGKSDLEVPVIGLGCMRLTELERWDIPKYLWHCISLGVNFFLGLVAVVNVAPLLEGTPGRFRDLGGSAVSDVPGDLGDGAVPVADLVVVHDGRVFDLTHHGVGFFDGAVIAATAVVLGRPGQILFALLDFFLSAGRGHTVQGVDLLQLQGSRFVVHVRHAEDVVVGSGGVALRVRAHGHGHAAPVAGLADEAVSVEAFVGLTDHEGHVAFRPEPLIVVPLFVGAHILALPVLTALERIQELLPESPAYFDKDQLTDKPARFFVSEIIREKILLYYDKEIPYSVEVSVERFKEDEKHIHINAIIYVERDSQKGIIIGHQGVALKKVSTEARKALEKFFDKPIYLEVFVKVDKDWRSSERELNHFGYNPE